MFNRKERRAIARGDGLRAESCRLFMPWDTPACFIQGEINVMSDIDADVREPQYWSEQMNELYWDQWQWQVNRPLIEQVR